MNTKDFNSILENIEELIEEKDYQGAIDYIKKEKKKALDEKDVVSEYMDGLAKNLK